MVVNLEAGAIWNDVYFLDLPFFSDKDFKDSCIDVDELLAPIIVELNSKGYKTDYCCSGHPGEDLMFYYGDKSDCFEDSGSIPEARAGYSYIPQNFYISFDPSYHICNSSHFSELAKRIPGIYYGQDNTVHYDYKTNPRRDYYGFCQERINLCKEIYAWAKALPRRR